MRLVTLSFENYRSFVDPTTIEIRPLTLLFGYNSAGKSAVMRLLPLLAASVTSANGPSLALDSEAARGASFRDLLSRLSSSPTLELALDWVGIGGSELALQLAIRDLPDRQIQILNRVRIEEKHDNVVVGDVEALWDTNNKRPGASSQRYDFKASNVPSEAGDLSVSGLTFNAPKGRTFSHLFEHASTALGELAEKTHWLNSLRAIPERSSRFGVTPKRIAPNGGNASEFLAHDAVGEGELLGMVSASFRRATGHQLAIKRYAVGGEQHYSVVTTPPNARLPVEVPIVDTGEGMAQVLPVIVLSCLAALGRLGEEPLLVIEHPELHLHPAAHSELAALLCSLVTTFSRPTVLLETHSENFLLRVQLAIARGDLSPQDVAVHWIRELEDGRSVVDTITFDEGARPTSWPPGVFAEDTEQAKALLKVRRERDLA
jgi:AAA ATPase domain